MRRTQVRDGDRVIGVVDELPRGKFAAWSYRAGRGNGPFTSYADADAWIRRAAPMFGSSEPKRADR